MSNIARLQKIEAGSRVLTIANSKKGVVRFIGDTQFASGEWIGIELDTPDGKNDGSVGDVRYFSCKANHGLFVKRAQIRLERDEVVSESKDKIAALREKRKAREAVSRPASPLEHDHTDSTKETVQEASTSVTEGNSTSDESLHSKIRDPHTQQSLSAPVTPLRPSHRSTVSESDIHGHSLAGVKGSDGDLGDAAADTEAGILEALRKDRDRLRVRVAELEHSLATQAVVTPASAIKERATLHAHARRVTELEEQVSELQQNLELLALDKEQVSMDLEEAQETIKQLESELAQAQIKAASSDAASTSTSSAGDTRSVGDLQLQVERLKEALLKLHQSSSVEAQTMRTRLRELEGAETRAQERAKEVDSLTQWQTQAKARIAELSQAVDEAAGYEAILEQLTEKNLELAAKNSQLADTVADLEASQEVMDELDASQRKEIDSLRRSIQSLEFQNRATQDTVTARDGQIEELRGANEKLKSIIEGLRQENQNLANQVALTVAELEELSERNKDALSQRRNLMSQTARARQLALLLRRSEISQRYAEAKSARLEALCPTVLTSRELRLFGLEAGLLRLVGRVALAAESLREELLSDTGSSNGLNSSNVNNTGPSSAAVVVTSFKTEFGVELLGDKAVRLGESSLILETLIRILGLGWIAIDFLSQNKLIDSPSSADKKYNNDNTNNSGKADEKGDEEEDGVQISNSLCPPFQDLERALQPLLLRLEEGEAVSSKEGISSSISPIYDALNLCVERLENSGVLVGIPFSTIAGRASTETEKGLNQESSRIGEVVATTVLLCTESRLLGVVAQLSLYENILSTESSADDVTEISVLLDTKDSVETLLGAIRGLFYGGDDVAPGSTATSTPSVLQQLNNLLGQEDNKAGIATSIATAVMNLGSSQRLVGLISSIDQITQVISSERMDLNTAHSSTRSSTDTLMNQRFISSLVSLKTSSEQTKNIVIEIGPTTTTTTTTTRSSSGRNSKIRISSFLSVSWAWSWLVEGRERDRVNTITTTSAANSGLATSSVSMSSWRRRCRAQKRKVESQLSSIESLPVLNETLLKTRSEFEKKTEELKAALRRSEELSLLVDRQAVSLVAAEEVAKREQERAKNEIDLQQEVLVLTEAINVLESRLEQQQGERKQQGFTIGFSGSGGGASGAFMDASEVDGIASSATLKSALLLMRSWRSLALRKLSLTLKPLPTLPNLIQTKFIQGLHESDGFVESKDGGVSKGEGIQTSDSILNHKLSKNDPRVAQLRKITNQIRLERVGIRVPILASAQVPMVPAGTVAPGSFNNKLITDKMVRCRRAAILQDQLADLFH